MYDVYKHVIGVTMKLPKRWNYSLGISIEQSILECLEELIMAKNAPKPLKAAYLIKASGHLEVITLKMCFLLENKLANETKFFRYRPFWQKLGECLEDGLNLCKVPRNANRQYSY